MMVRLVALALCFTALCARAALLELPTCNRALLEGHPEQFFMYVDRDFEGEKTKPWEGGQYGFVRGPVRTPAGVYCATVHEGIDICPVNRDAAGTPLDDVHAAAAGRVVHTSTQPGASNYGRYVVIEHTFDGSPFYTLYAHLASISVAPGDPVAKGAVIGRMGFSGAGIDRTRAHLHFEICMMMSRNFQGWYDALGGRDPNLHGLYNGMNLQGVDPAAVLKAAASAPGFRLAPHIAAIDPVFSVTIPASPSMSLLRDYPWLVPDGQPANPPAWTVSFSGTGVPVRAVAAEPVTAPRVAWVKDTPAPYHLVTRGLVSGPKGAPRLTDSGERLMKLLTWPE